jgi:outer membrane lipoprotein-sorting protein
LLANDGTAARQAVLAAIRAVATAGPYRIQSTTTSGNQTIQMTGEVVLPDRFHLTTNGQELLIIGDKTYMKENDRWVDFPIDIASLVSGMMSPLPAQAEEGITGVQELGAPTVNGAAARVYQYHQVIHSGKTTAAGTVNLWVGQQSGLPLQQEITAVIGGVRTTTMQVITFDPTIQITGP